MTRRLGKIQQDVVNYLRRCPPTGGYIGSTCRAEEFRGLDLSQVQKAVARLEERGLIVKVSDLPRYILRGDF